MAVSVRPDGAPQSRTVVELLRLVATLRGEYAACSELLSLTLELNRALERQVTSSRERYLCLLAQHRALISGRTNGEERQALDEALAMRDEADTRRAA